jgi:hypothetical protein
MVRPGPPNNVVEPPKFVSGSLEMSVVSWTFQTFDDPRCNVMLTGA